MYNSPIASMCCLAVPSTSAEQCFRALFVGIDSVVMTWIFWDHCDHHCGVTSHPADMDAKHEVS